MAAGRRRKEARLDSRNPLRSVVGVRSLIPEDGFTAKGLGTERTGSGVVIREDGLVLTIGYLITEADSVWLTGADGRVTPGHPLAYDQQAGFGLVQALGALDLPALALGESAAVKPGDPVMLASGGREQAVHAHVVHKQEFAGYWEYLLDEAIFTAPAHPLWGGAGLIGADGKLLGIGSLLVQSLTEGLQPQDINMVVPIDLLPPIMDDLLAYGRVNQEPRPWLGVFATDGERGVVVTDVTPGGPAAAAGLRAGDVISGVRDLAVDGLADFYRKLWSSGPAGVEVPLEIVRKGRGQWLRVRSADRAAFLKKPRLH